MGFTSHICTLQCLFQDFAWGGQMSSAQFEEGVGHISIRRGKQIPPQNNPV